MHAAGMWTIVSRRRDGSEPQLIALNASVADTFSTRFRGLMMKRKFGPGDGLVLTPCGSVHTMMMRFSIDLLCVSRGGEIVDMAHALAPWRMFVPKRRATSVIELPAGTLSCCDVRIGDMVEMDKLSVYLDAVGGLPLSRNKECLAGYRMN